MGKHGVIHKNGNHQRRTEPWPQLTCTENFVKFGCVVFEICEWTDIQTSSLQYFVPILGAKQTLQT